MYSKAELILCRLRKKKIEYSAVSLTCIFMWTFLDCVGEDFYGVFVQRCGIRYVDTSPLKGNFVAFIWFSRTLEKWNVLCFGRRFCALVMSEKDFLTLLCFVLFKEKAIIVAIVQYCVQSRESRSPEFKAPWQSNETPLTCFLYLESKISCLRDDWQRRETHHGDFIKLNTMWNELIMTFEASNDVTWKCFNSLASRWKPDWMFVSHFIAKARRCLERDVLISSGFVRVVVGGACLTYPGP